LLFQFLTCMQDVLFDLTQQSSQKIEVSASGKAFIRLSLSYLVESYTVLT
jgi:hypothetical protein